MRYAKSCHFIDYKIIQYSNILKKKVPDKAIPYTCFSYYVTWSHVLFLPVKPQHYIINGNNNEYKKGTHAPSISCLLVW